MLVSKLTEDRLTNELIDRLLYEGLEDKGENVDCIIVLGSIKAATYRVPVAAKAYAAGRSQKVLLCGGAKRKFLNGSMTEAEQMCKKAIELGVPEKSIMIENNSKNTIENILCSLLELQRSMWLNNVTSILLVTTTYHMRRSLHLARYFYPPHIKVYPCPADDKNTRRDNWMKTDEGIERVKAEAMNIVRCVNNRVIPDFEI